MAQNSQRTIQVQGRGKLSCRPDTVVLSFEISSKNLVYTEAVNGLNSRVESLRKAFENAGLKRELLKTNSFRVNYETKRQGGVDVFYGYKAEHTMTAELPVDKEQLDTVLNTIVSSGSVADLSICFTIKNSSEYHDRVISEAVTQAMHNAEIIAKTAGVGLGNILHINYGWSEVVFRNKFSEEFCLCENSQVAAPEMEPEDIDISETVTMVYELA